MESASVTSVTIPTSVVAAIRAPAENQKSPLDSRASGQRALERTNRRYRDLRQAMGRARRDLAPASLTRI
jgi:hypothetical protein